MATLPLEIFSKIFNFCCSKDEWVSIRSTSKLFKHLIDSKVSYGLTAERVARSPVVKIYFYIGMDLLETKNYRLEDVMDLWESPNAAEFLRHRCTFINVLPENQLGVSDLFNFARFVACAPSFVFHHLRRFNWDVAEGPDYSGIYSIFEPIIAKLPKYMEEIGIPFACHMEKSKSTLVTLLALKPAYLYLDLHRSVLPSVKEILETVENTYVNIHITASFFENWIESKRLIGEIEQRHIERKSPFLLVLTAFCFNSQSRNNKAVTVTPIAATPIDIRLHQLDNMIVLHSTMIQSIQSAFFQIHRGEDPNPPKRFRLKPLQDVLFLEVKKLPGFGRITSSAIMLSNETRHFELSEVDLQLGAILASIKDPHHIKMIEDIVVYVTKEVQFQHVFPENVVELTRTLPLEMAFEELTVEDSGLVCVSTDSKP